MERRTANEILTCILAVVAFSLCADVAETKKQNKPTIARVGLRRKWQEEGRIFCTRVIDWVPKISSALFNYWGFFLSSHFVVVVVAPIIQKARDGIIECTRTRRKPLFLKNAQNQARMRTVEQISFVLAFAFFRVRTSRIL